ncbi:MAG: hypothetical protein JW760_05760 [Spirochaetales bacterium]|nr:hypothetical protein [Spirochaetales bacterium]
METFYTYRVFFHILAGIVFLSLCIPLAMADRGKGKTFLNLGIFFFGSLFILSVVTPFQGWSDLFWDMIFPFFILLLIRIVLFLLSLRRPSLRSYQSWILESLRETVLIFNADLSLQGGGGPLTGLSPEASTELMERLRTLLRESRGDSPDDETPFEGTLWCEDRAYRYRFHPVRQGYLLTLLDVTSTQRLLNEVVEKNRLLERRKKILEVAKGQEVSLRRHRFRERVTAVIMDLVKDKMEILRGMLETSEDLEPVLTCAQEALKDIRLAVAQKSSEEEQP